MHALQSTETAGSRASSPGPMTLPQRRSWTCGQWSSSRAWSTSTSTCPRSRTPGSAPGSTCSPGWTDTSSHRARLRPGGGRGGGTPRAPRSGGGRHDHDRRLRGALARQRRRLLRRGRGARHPRRDRQGDDGPPHVRLGDRADGDPRDEPAAVGRTLRAMARPRRRAPELRVHAALCGELQQRDADRVGAPRGAIRRVLADAPLGGRR